MSTFPNAAEGGPNLAAHRCPACYIYKPFCVCSLAPRRALATRVVVFMHAKESRRTSNTGRFATLALQNAEVRLHGLKDRAPPVDGFDDGSTFVLFPGRGARPLTPEYAASLARPLTLVVPDGNWTQTKHMMHRVPLLASLPKVELPGPTLDLNRARRNVFSDRMSTFEAIAQALGTLEDQGVEEELLGFMRQAVDRMLMLRGKLSKKDVFGGLTAPGPLL